MKKNQYTIRSLMAKTGKTHAAAASLMRRMVRDKIAELAEVLPISPANPTTKVYVYELHIEPEQYINGIRATKIKPPKPGFYNNPFNLKGAEDARYATN
jgi:hypothetical protein